MPIAKDFENGKKGEERVCAILESIVGLKASKNSNVETRKFFDIICMYEKLLFTLEVKNDLYALKSGNIAIEVYNPLRDRESGLSITQADFWVFVIGNEVWLSLTHYLKEFTVKTKPDRIIDRGGDGNAHLYLYKKDKLMPGIFVRIDDIKPVRLLTVLEDFLNV